MEPDEMDKIEINASTEPAGEVVSPELAEKDAGLPAPLEEETHDEVEITPEQAEDDDDLKAAGLEQGTPAAHKWAEMRRERRDAKRAAEEAALEAARWKGRAEALAERGQVKEEVPAPPEPDYPARPNEDAFDDYSSYVEALADWKADIKLAQYEARQNAKEAEKAKGEQAAHAEKWFNTGKEKFPDFDVVVTKKPEEGGPAITHDMANVINSSQISHELAYHLGKNVMESRRIAALPPMEMAREMGKLEAKLTTTTATPKPRTQTNAPAPIRPIAGDGATAVTIDLGKLSEGDYIAEMNRREFGK